MINLSFAVVVFTILSLTNISCNSKKKTESSIQTPTVAPEKKILHIYTWSNYFSDDLINAFEVKSGYKIELNYFSSNEELLAKLQAGATGYDLIVPTGYLIKALKELKLIQPLGNIDWPEIKNLLTQVQAPEFDPKHEYSMPYSWGTAGIAVNRARIKSKVDSWAWVFEHPELTGQITMLDDAPAVVGAALKYLGYSLNEASPQALEKVKKLLQKQKKILKAYVAESQPVLESGEVTLAHVYSGDALQVNKKNSNIEYVFPKEGGEVFIDNLAIPRGAPSPEIAKQFIRFTLDQKVAVGQAQKLFFSPVVNLIGFPEANSILKNPIISPSKDQLQKFELMNDNPQRMESIQRLWTELKSG